MEAQQYVREYVRDQRAWRRAAQQPSTEQRLAVSGNMNALWDLCRVGSSENVETAQFAQTLRERNPNVPLVSHKAWIAPGTKPTSARGSQASPDILQVALQRNLKRMGLTIALDKAEAHQRQTAPMSARQAQSAFPGRRREALFAQYALNDLIVDEKVGREKLGKAQEREHAHLRKLVGLSYMNSLLDDEYNGRRLIFRAAVLEQKAILDAEQQAFHSRTGVTRDHFVAVSNLVGQETKHRQMLYRHEERDRVTLHQLIQLLQLESLEREITSCVRRETELRGVLTGTTKPC